MKRKLRILIPALLVGVLVLGAGAGLVMAQTTQPTTPLTPYDIFISKLAGKLGIAVEQLKTAITGAQTDTVNQLATEGRITAAQKDRMLEGIKQGPAGFGAFGGRGMMGGGYGMMGGTGYGMMGGTGYGPCWGSAAAPAK